MINVAVVGLGWVSQTIWLPLIWEHNDFSLCALYDTDQVTLEKLAHRYPSALPVNSVEEVIRCQPSLVFIATPNHTHVEYAKKFIRAGIAVFIEKPVCFKLDEVNVLQNLAGDRIPIFLSEAATYRSDINKASSIIKKGVLGDVRFVEASWVRAKGVPRPGGWFTHAGQSCGGVFVDLGWHLLDGLYHTVNLGSLNSLLASESSDFVGLTDEFKAGWRNDTGARLPIDVEDTMRVFLKFDNAISAFMKLAWASHESIDVTRFVWQGTLGTLELVTTFGFSKNGVYQPSLCLRKSGVEEEIEFDQESAGSEYEKQLSNIVSLMNVPVNNGLVWKKLSVISEIIEGTYKNAGEYCYA